MNDYLLALLLGVIEGLTEFIPVSSTAHLRLAQRFLDVEMESDYWKMFSVVIQLGAILSVVFYYRKSLTIMAKDFLRSSDRWNHPIGFILVAFTVTAVPAFLLAKTVSRNLEDMKLICWALIVGGVFMAAVDRWHPRPRVFSLEKMNLWRAGGIGAFQILSALFPGVSRSMSTIVGGQLLGLSRTAAVEFSFFVSLPTMFAAAGYDLLSYLRKGNFEAPDTAWLSLGVGFVSAFFTALLVIHLFLKCVKSWGFMPFAVYRIVFGLFVLSLL